MSETARLITQLAEARAMVERGELRLWAKTQEVTELEVERDEARANAERLWTTLAEQDNELETAREDVLRLTSERDAAQAEAERLRGETQRAVEAEREACASLFDGPVWAYDYREIAARIRARRGERR